MVVTKVPCGSGSSGPKEAFANLLLIPSMRTCEQTSYAG